MELTSSIMGLMVWLGFESWKQINLEPLMHGKVQSPCYPQPYPPNITKQWNLRVPEGYQLRLTFTHLDIVASARCCYDSITVFYGKRILGKFCGHENSTTILSPGNRLTLVFQAGSSNNKGQNVGFSAYYQAMVSCGRDIFHEAEGHLSSPGYPNSPPHTVSCQYVISVKPGFAISLNFNDNFHIESTSIAQDVVCHHDWLQVTISGSDPFRVCGMRSPAMIGTMSNRVTLDYHSDGKAPNTSWSLDYRTHRVRCQHPGRVTNGIVPHIWTDFFYGDYIIVQCDQGHKLMMDGQELQSFSTRCQQNGMWDRRLPECQLVTCEKPETLQNGWMKYLSGSHNEYQSVIQYGCNSPFYTLQVDNNVTFTCQVDGQWKSNMGNIVTPICTSVCGRPTTSILANPGNVGLAPEGSIPWQVHISSHGSRAGAVVISDRWLMTAAHWLIHFEEEDLKIFIGHTDIYSMLGSPLSAASFHIHPGFDTSDRFNFNNDIALIKLNDALTFNGSVMPLCLPTDEALYNSGNLGVTSGFGMIMSDSKFRISNELVYTHIPVVGQDTCQDSFKEIFTRKRSDLFPSLTNNMFCAGHPNRGNDLCHAFSGGPFAVQYNGSYWAAGIISWGVGCGVSGSYDVHTKVINYMDWVRRTMQEN
ncbi:complement C1r subcomponent isoform X2 [Corythoichthys intestinalis]|uniref:complement C1r subcomponent isoform X2 n=1 Tax=Corythoichthys intestinalis TaxID=161448 RepID=UPI0025A61832|nr:complement C1r subcomponent isoform X2 [Corythoichthys intestinalis]